jgi:hypothetical protein
MTDEDKIAENITELVAEIAPILHGHHPAVQASALAHLFTMWLAGWPDFLRDGLLGEFNRQVNDTVDDMDRLQHGPAGHPDNEGGHHANRNDPAGPDRSA